VRPDTAEQAKSLGATFVDTGVDARGEGGYARELSAEEKSKVASVLTTPFKVRPMSVHQLHIARCAIELT
jgi:NAD/NADP transhydrogenase alpha subunit